MNAQMLLHVFFTPKRTDLQDQEARFLATAIAGSAELDGVRIPMWSWGDGPRVVLMHGWESRGCHLARFVPALVTKGLAVTLFDAPAHGVAPGKMTSVVHMGKALLAVAKVLGPVQAVIAHSAGSAAALWAFGRGLDVDRSVHLAGPSTLEQLMRGAARMAALGEDEFPAFKAATAAFIGCPIEDLSVDRLASPLSHASLILHDPDDPMIPFSEAEALHARWPASTLAPVSRVGHRRILTDPGVIARCVEFVQPIQR